MYGIQSLSEKKIKELEQLELSPEKHQKEYQKIIGKSCICVGLGTSALIDKGIETMDEGIGVSVCPGPNMAYYDKQTSLLEMVDHIYGRNNIIRRNDRPHMFIKELQLYVHYFREKVEEINSDFNKKQEKNLIQFNENLRAGVLYYQQLFGKYKDSFKETKESILKELDQTYIKLQDLKTNMEEKFSVS